MKLPFRKFFAQLKLEVRLLGIFILFIVFFSFFRLPIGNVAAWMLGMTREFSIVDDSNLIHKSEKKTRKKTKKKRSKRAKKKGTTIRFKVNNQGKPQRINLPKTAIPLVLYSSHSLPWNDAKGVLFPKMRLFTGDNWDKEKTEFKVSTDGQKLFLLARLYDQSPGNAITENSKADPRSAWMDDSIEVFLMKNHNSTSYCQYIMSVSGIGYSYYFEAADNSINHNECKKPDDFFSPVFKMKKSSNYFELAITIDLSNIGIANLTHNGTFLIQIVRNYRGQLEGKSKSLQLFPTYIYADKRFGLQNHDRRAFQAIKIRKQ